MSGFQHLLSSARKFAICLCALPQSFLSRSIPMCLTWKTGKRDFHHITLPFHKPLLHLKCPSIISSSISSVSSVFSSSLDAPFHKSLSPPEVPHRHSQQCSSSSQSQVPEQRYVILNHHIFLKIACTIYTIYNIHALCKNQSTKPKS